MEQKWTPKWSRNGPHNGAEMDLKWSRNGPQNGPKMAAPASATSATWVTRNGRKHCATATFLQKWIRNGAEMDPEMEQKLTKTGAGIGPEMEQKWPRNGRTGRSECRYLGHRKRA